MSTTYDAEFISIVTDLATSLASNTHTDVQQDNFFRLAEQRKRLPQGSSTDVTESFLAVTISIISLKQNTTYSIKAIRVLHTFLRFDQSVFQIFKPNKPLLRKMNLSEHIMSATPTEVEAALELAAFLLRYHRSVDYGDFSDNAYVVQRIRRYCDYRFWYELEEQGGSQEELNSKFTSF